MSYSKPDENMQSPIACTIEWAGSYDAGHLKRYDKNKGENVKIGSPFGFIELDYRHGVQGFSSQHKASILSTEVKNISSESLSVFTFSSGNKVPIAEGVYKDIKGKFQAAGGKYAKIVYAIVTQSSDPVAKKGEMVKIIVKGSFTRPYIDVAKQGFEVLISGFNEERNGGTTFRSPKIELKPVSAEEDAAAMAADEKLQEWFMRWEQKKLQDVELGEVSYATPAGTPTPAQAADSEDDEIPF